MADGRPIDRWLARYEAAWAGGRGVAELFTPDARYFTAPYSPPLEGIEAIEAWWLARGESDVRWVFQCEVIAVDGRLHVVRGTTTYPDTLGPDGEAQVYYNLWLVTLADGGQASEFVEYWMLPE